MAASKRWIVTTSGDIPLSEIEDKLTDSGFAVDQVMDAIGVITGTTDDDDVIEQLRAVPGVTDVSPEDVIHIGPPDSPITW